MKEIKKMVEMMKEPDKLLHFHVCMLGTIFGSMLIGPIYASIMMVIFAVGKEIYDKMSGGIANRNDMIANYAGIISGLLLYGVAVSL